VKEIIDIITYVSNTSAPNIVVLAGFVLVLLSLVNKIGSHIRLPEKRHIEARVAGLFFLALGAILVHLSDDATPNLLLFTGITLVFLAITGNVGHFVELPHHQRKKTLIIAGIILTGGIGLTVLPGLSGSVVEPTPIAIATSPLKTAPFQTPTPEVVADEFSIPMMPSSTPISPTPTDILLCNQDVIIRSPHNWATVRGFVDFIGTAQHQKFEYYKVEYGSGVAPDDEQFTMVDIYSGANGIVKRQINNGVLATWNTNSDYIAKGTYTVRLTVVKTDGNFTHCKIFVVVDK